MAREIDTTQPFSNKLVKLIPTEIVGAYMVLAGLLGFDPTSTGAATAAQAMDAHFDVAKVAGKISSTELKPALIQVVFLALLVLTPLYSWRINKVSNIFQVFAKTFSYVIWVYTLGGPFVVWGLHYPLIGSVILVLWSVIMPLFIGPKPSTSVAVA